MTHIPMTLIHHALTIFAVLLVLCSPAFGQYSRKTDGIKANMQISYADYSAEEGGSEVASSSHFMQKYSLLWSKSALLGDGRLGKYDASLGVEWTYLDSETNFDNIFNPGVGWHSENKRDSFKLLYNGSVVIAPGALPFRLHAYSHDNASSYFTDSPAEYGSILNSSVFGDYLDGQTVVSGITLTAGIRNGSYLGSYRELLSRFPRVFVDYRQVLIRDLERLSPRHSLDKRLAFVSLNKKDNWFHYRSNRYEDYMDPRNNRDESQIILGSIDHYLRRSWIHLTNWLQISADATYDQSPTYRGDSQSYNLNAFSVANFEKMRISNFSNFSRSRTDSSLSQTLEIPVYGRGILSPELAWYAQARANSSEADIQATTQGAGYQTSRDSLYLQSKLNSTHWRKLLVIPDVAVAYLDEEDRYGVTQGVGVSAQLRVESDRRYYRQQSFYAEAALAGLTGDSDRLVENNYHEVHLAGGMRRRLNLSTDVGFDQVLRFGEGSPGQPYNDVKIRGIGTYSPNALTQITMDEGSGYLSLTNLYLEHRRNRLANRLDAIGSFVWMSDHPDMSSRFDFSLGHDLRYSAPKFTVLMENDFLYSPEGVRPDEVSFSEITFQADSEREDPQWSFLSEGSVEYSPQRAYEMQGDYKYSYADQRSHRFSLGQGFQFNVYTSRGMVRRLASFEQSFRYETVFGGDQEDVHSFTLSGGAHYYPTREWRLGAYLQDVYLTPIDQHEMSGGVSTSLTFSKLSIDISYQHGIRTATDNHEQRTERRLDVNLKKTL